MTAGPVGCGGRCRGVSEEPHNKWDPRWDIPFQARRRDEDEEAGDGRGERRKGAAVRRERCAHGTRLASRRVDAKPCAEG